MCQQAEAFHYWKQTPMPYLKSVNLNMHLPMLMGVSPLSIIAPPHITPAILTPLTTIPRIV